MNSEHGELVEKVARAINPGVWQLRDLMGNLDEWQAAELKASLAAAERAISAIQQDTVAGQAERVMKALWPLLGGNHTEAEMWCEIGEAVSAALSQERDDG